MSKCGAHWEWSLPGSLSFSVVLLRPTPGQRDCSAILRGHANHKRYIVSNVEGREINLHRPIPRAPGIEPGAAAWQVHTLPLVLLQPCHVIQCKICWTPFRLEFKPLVVHVKPEVLDKEEAPRSFSLSDYCSTLLLPGRRLLHLVIQGNSAFSLFTRGRHRTRSRSHFIFSQELF